MHGPRAWSTCMRMGRRFFERRQPPARSGAYSSARRARKYAFVIKLKKTRFTLRHNRYILSASLTYWPFGHLKGEYEKSSTGYALGFWVDRGFAGYHSGRRSADHCR